MQGHIMSSIHRPLIALLALCVIGPTARGQTQTAAPDAGATFQCQDGSKMVLAFAQAAEGIDAVVWLNGASHLLAWKAPEPGPVQVVWSDGEHSLTWSPGVQLMWMASDTHLMCGRGNHKH
jgi:hypothetical protein